MLNLMYITNNPQIACVAQNSGVDRIFVDMDYIGKTDRQGGMDTVQSRHTVEDVRALRKVVDKSELLVRVNPIHDATDEYCSSKEEIDAVIDAGADVVMLPFFKTEEEVAKFISIVDGRVKTMLLLETPQAVERIDQILALEGIDEIHIGLNDLSLGYGMKFMFELLANGTVERLIEKIKAKNIVYGFGGIARLGYGMIQAEMVITEHYRLGSTRAILSRSFCNANQIKEIDKIEQLFKTELLKIREFEKKVSLYDAGEFEENRIKTERIIKDVSKG